MDRRKVCGNISVGLTIVPALLLICNKDEESVGDYIFNWIGIGAWSNGSTGLHYPVLFSLALIIVGFIGVKICYGSIDSRWIIGMLTFLILMPSVITWTQNAVRTFSKGLSAVEYIKKDSVCKFETKQGDEYAYFTANIFLKNNGFKELRFKLDLSPCEQEIRGMLKEDNISVEKFEFDTHHESVMPPEGSEMICVKFKAKLDSKSDTSGSGAINSPDIILYNTEQRILYKGGTH